MNITHEILENYLDNKLSAIDKNEVDKLLRADETLRDALDGIKAMRDDKIDMDEFFRKSAKKIQGINKQKSIFHLNYKLGIAASIILIIGLTFAFQYHSNPHVSDFDFSDAGLPVHLDIEDSSNYNEFTNLYKLGNYINAEDKIDILMEDYSTNDTLLYYKACILKEQNKYTEALDFYQGIDSSSEYFEKANYQSAMCYWYLDDTQKLKNSLTKITSNPNHLFYDRALLILEKL